MTSKKFQELYNKLNSAQRQAVDEIEGSVMVVAGPGTGKTQILTLRIANILKKTDIEPQNILALTFTESGVVSMRRRLSEIISTSAYSVNINTFHGFCNDLIKNYPEKFPRIIGSENITEVEQLKIIEEIVESIQLKILRPFGSPFLYVRDIVSAINDVKREGVAPEKFNKIIDKEYKLVEGASDLYHDKGAYKGKMKGMHVKTLENIAKNKEFAKVYAKYEKRLEKENLYDYSDMLVEAMRAMESDKDLLLTLQEEYQYILVDEHQDTNNVQNRIMELLTNFHENPNIFVVGDEKQAIFRFQGASLENFYYFRNIYPKAKIIVLEENYRSTQGILDSAHSVLAGEKELKSNYREKSKIRLYPFQRREASNFFIAKDINRLISEGIDPAEIAIIYRENKDAHAIADALEREGVPYTIESEENILLDPEVRKILLLLRAVAEFGSPEAFIEASHIDFIDIEPLDVYKLVRYSADNKIDVLDLTKNITTLEKIGLGNPDKINDFYNNLSRWSRISKNRGLTEFFEIIINESGALQHILAESDPFGKMDKLNAVFDAVKDIAERNKKARLEELMEYFDILERHNRSIGRSIIHRTGGRVRLMTAHRSKGQEFEYVFLINCVYGHWGDKRRPERIKLPDAVYSLTGKAFKDSVEDGDERRLFYVALTRAKKMVSMIYAKDESSKGDALPSRFIEDIDDDLIESVGTERYEKEFDSKIGAQFTPRRAVGPGLKDKEFVRELFLRKGFSVTELNNYLRCPWRYFYTNLIRVPRAPNKNQMYGIAIHAALNDLFSGGAEPVRQAQGKPTKTRLLKNFEEYLNKQPLSEVDFEEMFQKGKSALSGYFDKYHKDWNAVLKTEFNVRGVELTPEIRLTGKIDRIDVLDDRGNVKVIDYKTSQPKSRAEIEGKTKAIGAGDAKRQLIFYKLLLDNMDNSKLKMVSGEIDFVEPDAKGRYKKEEFVINDEEIKNLEELVKKTANEILEMSFWDRKCDDNKCEFCALRGILKS
ncbi:MAG TPA: ATP-dependent DNA helicase [Candidatus Paceibacterota bacterium]